MEFFGFLTDRHLIFLQFIIAMFLFHADTHTCYGQSEARCVSRIEGLGGAVIRNTDGDVYAISCVIKKTKDFFFSDTDIESIDFSVFPQLTHVTICSRKFTDRSLIQLQKIKGRLQNLNIAGGSYSDKEVTKLLRAQPSLRSISLSNSNITDQTLQVIGELESLEMLSLSSTDITNGGLLHLAKLKTLRLLNLSNTRIGDTGLEKIGQIMSLRTLVLDCTPITDVGLQDLHKLKKLATLSIKSTKTTKNGAAALETSVLGVVILR